MNLSELVNEKLNSPLEEKPLTENSIFTFSEWDKLKRLLNSPAFDRASYEADGGDAWINPGRREFFENPGNVDEALWAKAKEASMKAFGKEKWQFVTWFYKKQGGKFE